MTIQKLNKGWRSWTHNYADKAMDAEKRFGVVTKVIFASVYLTGGGEKNVAFYPRIWDRSRYAETAKNLHAEGKIIGLYLDPMWMSMGILKNPVHSIPPDWNPATDCIENENSGQNNTFRWRPPEIKFFDEWKVEPSSFAPYYKERGESQFMASLKSRYADFLCYLVEEQAKMGADGITDIDEWVPMPDMNSRHDTGFSGRDGKKYPEYDWFGRRELLKRFCAIFLKERGKPPIMFAHTVATLTIPCTSLCDGILTGENSNAGYLSDEQYYDEYFKGKNEVLNCIKNGGENWYYYAVPIDRWAVECGKQFGFAVMVMSNLAKNKFNPSISQSENATRDFLATAIIHDNLIWPIFCNPDPAYKLLKIRQDFKIDDDNVIFYPYWGSKKPAMTSSENVYISTYRNNDKFLINISNLGLDDKDLEISLNPDFFKNGEIAKVINAESKEELTVEKNVVKTNLNKRNYKIFIAE